MVRRLLHKNAHVLHDVHEFIRTVAGVQLHLGGGAQQFGEKLGSAAPEGLLPEHKSKKIEHHYNLSCQR